MAGDSAGVGVAAGVVASAAGAAAVAGCSTSTNRAEKRGRWRGTGGARGCNEADVARALTAGLEPAPCAAAVEAVAFGAELLLFDVELSLAAAGAVALLLAVAFATLTALDCRGVAFAVAEAEFVLCTICASGTFVIVTTTRVSDTVRNGRGSC